MRQFSKHVELMELTVLGLKNCVNLRSVTWTREGSLTSAIMSVLASLPALDRLEINGHDSGNYDPNILTQFTHLTQLSVIMPSAAIVGQLHPWFQLQRVQLTHLTFICKV